jgi:hypothetical protein
MLPPCRGPPALATRPAPDDHLTESLHAHTVDQPESAKDEFGSYGFYKSIGYTAGPLLGSLLVAGGGLPLLFTAMTALAAAVAAWAALAVPAVPPLPKARQTVADLAKWLGQGSFLRPTAALALATAALSVGVGFLPVAGATAHLGPVATGAAVSLLAASAALIQPRAEAALDHGRITTTTTGISTGLAVTATGLATAMLPGLPGLLLAAVLIGAGTGLITPLGFAALATASPPERLGQTMGAAELGRELGDAGGPVLVAAVAAATTLTAGFAALTALTFAAGLASRPAGRRRNPVTSGHVLPGGGHLRVNSDRSPVC